MRYPSTMLASALQHLVWNHKARLGINIPLDHLKLQTVLFFVRANALCKNGKSVVADRPVASDVGPIFQAVYDQLNTWIGSSVVDVPVRTLSRTGKTSSTFKMPPMSDDNLWGLMELTLDRFANYSTEELIAAAQTADGPWARTRAKGIDEISDLIIVSSLQD